jgi:hypothetical protein
LACGLLAACAPSTPAVVPAAAVPAPGPLLLAEAIASPPPAPPPRSDQTNERLEHDRARTYGWIAVGIGSVAGVVAIYTSIQMLNDKSIRDAHCNAAKACDADGFNANTDLAGASGWNIGSWVVAAAGLGAGAFLVLTNPSEKQKGTQVGVAPSGSGASLTLRGAF